MKGFGWVVLLVGGAVGAYALLVFDTSVASGVGRINNIGLISDRQNLLIASGVGVIAGLMMILLGKESDPPPPFFIALRQGDLAKMEDLLKTGAADPNGVAPDGFTWLLTAVHAHAVAQSELLLRYGADPDLRTERSFPSPREYIQSTAAIDASVVEKELLALFDKYAPGESRSRPESQRSSPELAGGDGLAVQIQKLADLRDKGVLTSAEFERAKEKLLG